LPFPCPFPPRDDELATRDDGVDQYNVQMHIEFTQHALTRMVERGISRDEVVTTLDHPLRTVNAQNSRFEAQGWIERSPRRLLLRVICEDGVVVTVVTVMATSKFEKYGVTL
jgi:hypothetical protein